MTRELSHQVPYPVIYDAHHSTRLRLLYSPFQTQLPLNTFMFPHGTKFNWFCVGVSIPAVAECTGCNPLLLLCEETRSLALGLLRLTPVTNNQATITDVMFRPQNSLSLGKNHGGLRSAGDRYVKPFLLCIMIAPPALC